MTSIFVFIDESGNFDFSSSGTNHFVMAAVTCRDPVSTASEMLKLKYELMAQGVDLAHFHASEDKQSTRDRVFPLIARMESISADTLWIDKHYVAPALQHTAGIYSAFGGAIATLLLRTLTEESYDEVILVFDKALKNSDEKAFLSEVKPRLRKLNQPFKIYFQSVKLDFNGQVADYIAWAHYVSLEKDEMRPLGELPMRLTKQVNLSSASLHRSD